MSYELRLLEGELVIHNGVGFIVKGYQHPGDYVIAYPRYDLMNYVKIPAYLITKHLSITYWDCIKQYVNIVPRENLVKHSHKTINSQNHWLKDYLSSILDIDTNDIEFTGSIGIIDKWHDIDLVIYGCTEEVVNKINAFVERGILKRAGEHVLIKEYFEKHRDKLSLIEYLYLKKHTVLHLDVMGYHVNLKLYRYSKGFTTCVNPVIQVYSFTGEVYVFKNLTHSLLPSIYLARTSSVEELFIETHRELYAELIPGMYYAENCRLEHRKNGLFLVPDNCVFRPINDLTIIVKTVL